MSVHYDVFVYVWVFTVYVVALLMITHATVTWRGLINIFIMHRNTPSMGMRNLQFSKQPRAFGPIYLAFMFTQEISASVENSPLVSEGRLVNK